jgi:SAM-dependent methyltransferase
MSPIAGLECLRCRSSDLDGRDGRLECRDCGSSYPVLGRVPVMFEDALPVDGDEPDTATIHQVLGALGLGAASEDAVRVRRMFRRGARFGDEQVQVESAQLLDRMRGTGHGIGGNDRQADATTPAAPPPPPPPVDDPAAVEVPRYRWTLDYVPRLLPRAAETTANLRFRNTGPVAFRHQPPHEVRVHVSWFDEAGGQVDAPDVRTPLPVDVPPGRELTVPAFIPTPRAAGRLQLQLSFVQEGVRFLHDDAKRIAVKVGEAPPDPGLPAGWVLHGGPPRDYDEDHRHAQEVLRRWLRPMREKRLRVLEIGGNVHPSAAGLANLDLYNLDVDLLGLQLGELLHRRDGRRVSFLCADAEDLPFPPGFFDAVVMFATLHHFPDPARVLGHVATRVRPGGFVGVLCEPVGHIHPGSTSEEFLSELRKGVNEQSFTASEYDAIFRRARLRAEEAFIDIHSLKARLVPL